MGLALCALLTSAAQGQGVPSLFDTVASGVAAGGGHSCALATDGGIRCWGNNAYGQLGDGSTTASTEPVAVNGLGGVAAIAAGGNHACALSATGDVWCWGHNGYGQLGNDSSTNSSVPVAVIGLGGVAAIVAGDNHTCALTAAGGIRCWGANGNGQLGNDSTTSSGVPVAVSGMGGDVAAIAAGGMHTCAVTMAGAAWCWGANASGQLGNGGSTGSGVPVAVNGLASGAVAIAAGGSHGCALTTADAVRCWGSNGFGQLGDGTLADSAEPVAVSGLGSGVKTIAAGFGHTCARGTIGGLHCWGRNQSGQLGNDATANSAVPVAVSDSGSRVMAVATGGSHTCAVTATGGILCWGRNNFGQLGNGASADRHVPVSVSGLADGTAMIATGGYHTCALTTASGIHCWGLGSNGQLGNGSSWSHTAPVAVNGLASDTATIAAGVYHTCALSIAGAVRCWGRNNAGQLGNGGASESAVPVAVSGLDSGVTSIVAGREHTCALTATGEIRCWGLNDRGQLGNGTNVDSVVPVAVTGFGSTAKALAAGDYHTCALTTTGAVRCWGLGAYGQLGYGATTSRNVPTAVTDLDSGVTAIAADGHHSCALTAAGGVLCWGRNGQGQLGNGVTTNQVVPAAVVGLDSGVAAISAGEEHTCALTTAGEARCWGDNTRGQLGDGSTTNRHLWVTVNGLDSGVNALAAGADHTCALTTTAGVRCWGSNLSGQLGNDSMAGDFSVAPVAIRSGQSLVFAPGNAGTPLDTIGLGQPLILTATATSGGNATIVFDSWTPETCSIVGTTLTAAAAGLCGVRAARTGGGDGAGGTNAAAPQALRLLRVMRGEQAASNATATPAVLIPGQTSQLAFSGGSGQGAVTYSVDSGPCSVSGELATAIDIGTCIVRATKAGDANYLPASATTTIVVNAAPPIALPQSVNVRFNEPTAITLGATDDNPGGPHEFSYAIAASPMYGSVDLEGGIVTYTPTTGHVGSDSFTFTATTVHGTSMPATVSLSVAAAVPPIVFDASANVPFNTRWNIALGYRDYNYGGPFAASFSIVTPPAHGNVTFFNNIAIYTPTLGYSGADIFTFTAATVNGTSNVATVSVTVAQGVLPVAQAGSASVPYATPTPIALGATDANPGGPFDFTWAIATPPAHGTLSSFDANTGTLIYTPEDGYSGADGFSFAVSTVNGTSTPASVDITVGPSPARLVFSIDDGCDYVHYGQFVDYTVVLANEGGSPAALVPVAFALSAGFDGDFAQLACFGDGDGASCTPDLADPLRFTVTLPPGRNLTWMISAPVRGDTDAAHVDFGARAAGADAVIDTNALVIHRDGFDMPCRDGARAASTLEGESAKALLDGDALREIVVPVLAPHTTTLLNVRDRARDVSVEGVVIAGDTRVRLRERDAEGRARVTAWSVTQVGATLTLGSVRVENRFMDGAEATQRVIVLIGARSPLTLR